jgi:hypothetical protein
MDRALERFRAEMATQHSLVTKTIITSGSTSVIKASDILEWSRLFAASDVLPEGEELAWEYCRRVSLCSESELKNMLGENVHAPDNITHLGKLAALIINNGRLPRTSLLEWRRLYLLSLWMALMASQGCG